MDTFVEFTLREYIAHIMILGCVFILAQIIGRWGVIKVSKYVRRYKKGRDIEIGYTGIYDTKLFATSNKRGFVKATKRPSVDT